MSNFISVNTRMNFDFKVEEHVIYQAINQFFESQDSIILTKKPIINIKNSTNNIEIFISYKLKKEAILSFETKNAIFMLEQRIYSLINVRPNNINIVFEGIENV
ncbi:MULTISPECIES: MMB_0454 family protein [unclassified Mycoplasma]|uniref:MMB_0454 family protein n=1 Tax=Mycoplasma sp. 125 TaxID=3447505 RepID=UPI003F659FB8